MKHAKLNQAEATQQPAHRLSLPPALADFVSVLKQARTRTHDEATMQAYALHATQKLIKQKNWMPEWAHALFKTNPDAERAYVLHSDPSEHGLMILLIVWGQGAPSLPHDHQTWAVFGVAEGEERMQSYRCNALAENHFASLELTETQKLKPGEAQALPHDIIHAVSNTTPKGQPAISIHVYGRDLRHSGRYEYDPERGVRYPNANEEFIDVITP
jgi:predicted metal-dependent enzyme (double-stranded beta helix superfamily)